jgi:hypothetical protein
MEVKSIMPNYEFITANITSHREALIQLNVEYLSWVFAGIEEQFGVPADQIVGMPVSEYVPGVIDKFAGRRRPWEFFIWLKSMTNWRAWADCDFCVVVSRKSNVFIFGLHFVA